MSNKNRNQPQKQSTGTAKSPVETTEVKQDQTNLNTEQDQTNTGAEQASETGADQAQETTAPEIGKAAPVVQDIKPAETETAKVQHKSSHSQAQKGFKPVYKVELELTGYAEAMDKSKPMVPAEGGKWQYSLFKAIKSIFLAKSQEDFNNEFNTVLSFFNKNKEGTFNEKFIFRFPENWAGSQNEYTQNRRLIYLIIQTADPKGRKKALDEINMELVAAGMSEAQKQMLFNFYQM